MIKNLPVIYRSDTTTSGQTATDFDIDSEMIDLLVECDIEVYLMITSIVC